MEVISQQFWIGLNEEKNKDGSSLVTSDDIERLLREILTGKVVGKFMNKSRSSRI